MVAIRIRKHELTAEEIAAVQLSDRQQYGEYVTYTALSRDGVTRYTVTLNAEGRATGCTCPARVDCRHKAAAEFEEAWTSPVNVAYLVGADIAQDMTAHVEDSMSELNQIADEVEGELAAQAWVVLQAEYKRKCSLNAPREPKVAVAPSGAWVPMR